MTTFNVCKVTKYPLCTPTYLYCLCLLTVTADKPCRNRRRSTVAVVQCSASDTENTLSEEMLVVDDNTTHLAHKLNLGHMSSFPCQKLSTSGPLSVQVR